LLSYITDSDIKDNGFNKVGIIIKIHYMCHIYDQTRSLNLYESKKISRIYIIELRCLSMAP